MNIVAITGRLTKDPEVREKDQYKVAQFTVAVDRDVKKEGSPEADFFDVVCFGNRAEFLRKYFTKGMKIEVAGRLEQNRFDDKEGRHHSTVRIVGNTVKFGESKNASIQNAPATVSNAQSAPAQAPLDPTQAVKQAANASIDNLLMQVDDMPELPF